MNDIKSVLFVCNMNAVRSPMASRRLHALMGDLVRCESAGVHSTRAHSTRATNNDVDALTEQVLAEKGIKMDGYYSKSLGDISFDQFDLIIAMTIEAASEIRKLSPSSRIEFWAIEDPSARITNGEQALDAYRAVRDSIFEKITDRFPLSD